MNAPKGTPNVVFISREDHLVKRVEMTAKEMKAREEWWAVQQRANELQEVLNKEILVRAKYEKDIRDGHLQVED